MTTSRAQTTRVVALTATWAFAFFFMVMGTFEMGGDSDPSQRAWFSWGIFTAMVAQVPTGWCVVARHARRERLRMEYLARIIAGEMQHRDDEPSGTVVNLR